jgi:hypothetical protein
MMMMMMIIIIITIIIIVVVVIMAIQPFDVPWPLFLFLNPTYSQ